MRSAGRSLRLYRDGVFHSQYNGSRPLNGGVWDMLWLPLCFRPPESIRRVAMLGVGAGAALKKISDYFPQAELVGVELDPVHIELARRFVLRDGDARLVCADAVKWLQRSGAGRFDVIVDDLFGEGMDGPRRAWPLDSAWCAALAKKLVPGGLLVANCVELAEAHRLYKHGTERYAHAVSLGEAGYDNRVVAASGSALDVGTLRQNFALLMQRQFGKRGARLPRTLSLRKLR